MRSSNFKTGDRIRIRDYRPCTESDWLYGVYVRTHPKRAHVVIRLDDDSVRAWPRHRVYKVKKK